MTSLRKRALEFLASEQAPTATEYAVMLALVIVVAVAAVTFLGRQVSGSMSSTVNVMP